VIGVFTGGSLTGLTKIASDDDSCSGGASAAPSTLTFAAAAGTTYPIAVDAYPGSPGPFTMNVSFVNTDTTAPNTLIDKAPKKKTTKKKVTIEFSSDDPSAHFECKVDKGDFEACTSPLKVKAKKPGKHKVAVHAIDAAGNVGPDANVSWKYKKKKKK
jgi:hypothetical protein